MIVSVIVVVCASGHAAMDEGKCNSLWASVISCLFRNFMCKGVRNFVLKSLGGCQHECFSIIVALHLIMRLSIGVTARIDFCKFTSDYVCI